MDQLNKYNLMVSAQRALIYNVPPSVRQISADISQSPLIRVIVCSGRALSEDDVDSIYLAMGEICGDFAAPDVDSDVSFIVDDGEIMNLRRLPILLFSHSR